MFSQLIERITDVSSPFFLSLILFTAVIVIRFILLNILLRRIKNYATRFYWRRLSSYILAIALVLMLLPVWMPSLQRLAAFLGLFGAGLLIVFKEIFLNIAGWIFIAARRPFLMGDRVQTGDIIGDVVDIRLIEFSVIEVTPREKGGQSTGRIVHIPNMKLFTDPLVNASKEFAFNWNELRFSLKQTADIAKAEAVIMQAAGEVLHDIDPDDHRLKTARRQLSIHYDILGPKVFIETDHDNIILVLRHLTEPRGTRLLTDEINRIVLRGFRENGISLAEGR